MKQNALVVVIRLIILAVAFIPIPASLSDAGNDSYVLAVIPAAPPVTVHTHWAPVIERLSRETHLNIRLKMYEKMSEFERDISVGLPDFIFANPLQAVVAYEAQGYVPLVRGGRHVSAQVFVRRDSEIKTVDDLMGKKIALVGNKNL